MILEFYQQICEKYHNIKFHENPSSGNRVVPCGRRDRHTWRSWLSLFSILRTRVKAFKSFPVNDIETYGRRGGRCVAPLILNLGARWRWVANKMPAELRIKYLSDNRNINTRLIITERGEVTKCYSLRNTLFCSEYWAVDIFQSQDNSWCNLRWGY
jgi:hypothetical protein